MGRFTLFFISFLGLATAIAVAATAPPPLVEKAEQATEVVVEKAARKMTLFRGENALAVYEVALGFSPEGDKLREGDGRTPEGVYHIDRRNDQSGYHLSLGLSYPTPKQREAAAREGRDPGGDIFIHGQPNALPNGLTIPGDWTAGCIAVTNAEIEEIWSLLPIGAKVIVKP